MLTTLQLSSLSYLTTAPPQHTCAAAPRAWSVSRPPMCAKRTATLLGLSTSAGLDEEPANASAKVLELASLWMYPVKSVRAVAVSTARLGPEGLDGDRRLLVASAANLALTQRQHPLLATVSATLEGNRLSLRAPGQPTLNETIPLEAGKPVTAALFGSAISLFDQGQAAAKWLTALLDTGRPSVLPLLGISAYKLLAAPARTPFALLPRPLTRALVCALALALSPSRRRPPTPVTRTRTRIRHREQVRSGRAAGLSDLAPLLILCEESVADLNARRAARRQPPVGLDRFRPNLVRSPPRSRRSPRSGRSIIDLPRSRGRCYAAAPLSRRIGGAASPSGRRRCASRARMPICNPNP